MKKHFYSLFAIGLLCINSGLLAQGSSHDESLEMHPNQYFVKLCHGTSHKEAQELMAELNSVELWKNDKIGLRLWAVKEFPYSCSQGKITDLNEHLGNAKKKTGLDDVTLDMIFELEVADISDVDENSYFDNLNLRGELGSSRLKISILDSGISDKAIAKNPNLSGPVSYTGYDYVDNDTDPNDLHGHGTYIAGLIYGIISEVGSPFNISFDIRKTHNELGLGNISDLISATIDAVDAGADIINMSFSYYEMLDEGGLNPLQLAIDYAEQNGVLVVVSAGNRFNDNDNSDLVPIPATFSNDNIISVASNSPDEMLSVFSNFGSSSVDVSILGEDIPGPDLFGMQQYASGTSFSAAIVSALSVIVGSRQDQFNGCEIKCAFINTSKKIPGLQGFNQSGGVIDFKRALKEPANNCQEICKNVVPEDELDCGANCPPETEDMNLCVEAGTKISDKLLVYDAEGDPIKFSIEPVYGPFNGRVRINSDGTFTYGSYDGEPDMFVYQVCDGNQTACSDGCNQGVVYINNVGCVPPSNSMNEQPTGLDFAINQYQGQRCLREMMTLKKK